MAFSYISKATDFCRHETHLNDLQFMISWSLNLGTFAFSAISGLKVAAATPWCDESRHIQMQCLTAFAPSCLNVSMCYWNHASSATQMLCFMHGLWSWQGNTSHQSNCMSGCLDHSEIHHQIPWLFSGWVNRGSWCMSLLSESVVRVMKERCGAATKS